jgi:putative drug exporter of the RND superfamily
VVVSAPDYLNPGAVGLVSRDGHATIIPVTIAKDFDNATANSARLAAVIHKVQYPPFQVLIAGPAQSQRDFTRIAEKDMGKAESIGIGTALLVLLVVFGAVVASLLPLSLGIVAIAVAMGEVGLFGLVFTSRSRLPTWCR